MTRSTTNSAEIISALYAGESFLVRRRQALRLAVSPMDRLASCFPSGSRVLDVGCGAGVLLGLLAYRGSIHSGLGFDTDAEAIAAAQRMAARVAGSGSSTELRFETLSVNDPWPEGPFDAVSMIDVLHHVPPRQQQQVIEAAAARVPAGGQFIYKDMVRRPRWRAWANRLHDLLFARQWIHYRPVEDVERWATSSGLRLCESADLQQLWYGHELRIFCRD